MRWPLVVVALFIGVVPLDRYVNHSSYTAELERGVRQAIEDMPG